MTGKEFADLLGISYATFKRKKAQGLIAQDGSGSWIEVAAEGSQEGSSPEPLSLEPREPRACEPYEPSEAHAPEPLSLEPLTVALEEVAALREVIERQQEQIDRLTTRVVEIENQIGEFEPDTPLAMDGAGVGEKLDEVLARLGAIETFLKRKAGYVPARRAGEHFDRNIDGIA
jgi:hypothetical protein